jgi:hypothetical protein
LLELLELKEFTIEERKFSLVRGFGAISIFFFFVATKGTSYSSAVLGFLGAKSQIFFASVTNVMSQSSFHRNTTALYHVRRFAHDIETDWTVGHVCIQLYSSKAVYYRFNFLNRAVEIVPL